MNIQIFYRENDRTQGIMSSLLHLVKTNYPEHRIDNYQVGYIAWYPSILIVPVDSKMFHPVHTKFVLEYEYKHKAKSKNECIITKSFLPELLGKVFNTPHEALCSILNHPYYTEKVCVYTLSWHIGQVRYESKEIPKYQFNKQISQHKHELGFIRDTDYNSIIDTLNLKIKEKRDELNLLMATLDKVYLDVDKGEVNNEN